jgi:hypothetical protein
MDLTLPRKYSRKTQGFSRILQKTLKKNSRILKDFQGFSGKSKLLKSTKKVLKSTKKVV